MASFQALSAVPPRTPPAVHVHGSSDLRISLLRNPRLILCSELTMTLPAVTNWKCLLSKTLTGNARVHLTERSCLLRPLKVLLFGKE